MTDRNITEHARSIPDDTLVREQLQELRVEEDRRDRAPAKKHLYANNHANDAEMEVGSSNMVSRVQNSMLILFHNL